MWLVQYNNTTITYDYVNHGNIWMRVRFSTFSNHSNNMIKVYILLYILDDRDKFGSNNLLY